MAFSPQTGVFTLIGFVAGVLTTFLFSTFHDGHLLVPMGMTDQVVNCTTRSLTSHEEVDRYPVPDKIKEFKDSLKHNDNSNIAEALRNQVRVICWITTSGDSVDKANHVAATWGKRCDKLIFFSDKMDVQNSTLNVIKLDIDHGRDHLTGKTMAAFDYLYKNHLDDADWFMKADDDTYVVVENLRYMLSSHHHDEPVYFGHHFKTIIEQGYASGGGGYIISKEALRRFGGRDTSKNLCRGDGGAEDAEFGRCMENLNVTVGDSRDALGRSRLHCFDAATFIAGGFPDWYFKYDKYGAKQGLNSLSDYAISFHYITAQDMYTLEYYVYHLRPYGILSGIQDLNSQTYKQPNKEDDTTETPKELEEKS